MIRLDNNFQTDKEDEDKLDTILTVEEMKNTR